MPVKIVTDSMSDIPRQVDKDLGITVVPGYMRFGPEIYRDGIDITPGDFYRRLQTETVLPATSQASPRDFEEVYRKLAKSSDGILSIHISAKLSGTYESALVASTRINAEGARIRLVDSLSVTMGVGLLVIEAARMARDGMGLDELYEKTRRMVSEIHMMGFFDTLRYSALGGRIGKARAFVGSILNVKPMLSMKDGEIVPITQLRSRSKATERLHEFVKSAGNVKNLAVVYSTTPDEASALARRLDDVFPAEKTIIAQLGATLGVHGGPGILFVAVLGDY